MGSSHVAASEEEMRRPALCCDSSTQVCADGPCKEQRPGPMARMRRFFASPTTPSRPSASSAYHVPPSLDLGASSSKRYLEDRSALLQEDCCSALEDGPSAIEDVASLVDDADSDEWCSVGRTESALCLEDVKDFGVPLELQTKGRQEGVPRLLEHILACLVANDRSAPALSTPHHPPNPALLPALSAGLCSPRRAPALLRHYLAALPASLMSYIVLGRVQQAMGTSNPVHAVRAVLQGADTAALCSVVAAVAGLGGSNTAWPIVSVAVAGEGRHADGKAVAVFLLDNVAEVFSATGPAPADMDESASSGRDTSPSPPPYRGGEGGAHSTSCVDTGESEGGCGSYVSDSYVSDPCVSDAYSALPLPYSYRPRTECTSDVQSERKLSIPWSIISDIETPAESDSSAVLASSPWGTADLPAPALTAHAHTPAPLHHHRKRKKSRQHRRHSPSPSSRESEPASATEAPSLSALVADNEPVVSAVGRSWGQGSYSSHIDDTPEPSPAMSWLTYDTRPAHDTNDTSANDAYDTTPNHDTFEPLSDHDRFDPLSDNDRYDSRTDNDRYDSRSDNDRYATRSGPARPERHAGPLARAVNAGKSSGQRNMSSIKRKIAAFEEEFERKFGYKPSHSEKMKHRDIKKYMQQLSKSRKEIKMMKEGVAELVEASSKVFPLSLLRCQEATPDQSRSQPSEADLLSTTLACVMERLKAARCHDQRPQDITLMTGRQVEQEKTALQKVLLYYESLHGRPTTREAKQLARPLYDRYRQVKRSVSRAELRSKECAMELAPIIEHVVMDFTLASPVHRTSLTEDEEPSVAIEVPPTPSPPSPTSSSPEDTQCTVLGNLHSLPPHELRDRRREARVNKKRARRNLRAFEDRYEKDNGHKPPREERGAAEALYVDYKHAKAKLRLLEALISKTNREEDEAFGR